MYRVLASLIFRRGLSVFEISVRIAHEIVGQGGQGVTKRVENKKTGEIGCLKVLSKQNDMERRLRFSREASAYDTCNHFLIPTLLASNAHCHANTECKLFLVTEFIAGPTLSERILNEGTLKWGDALKLTAELLRVVQYLHENDWVHRDIKPDNIILRDGQVAAPVLLDFGLSYKEGVAQTLDTEHGHPNAMSMLSALENLLMHRGYEGSGPEEDLAFIKSHLQRESVAELQILSTNCRAVYNAMDNIVNGVVAELNGQFVRTQGGMQQRGASVHTNLGVAQSDNHEIRFSPRWEIDVRGSDIVVCSSSEFLFRLDALKPETSGEFSLSVRTHLLKGVRGLIEAPSRQVIYRGFFKATPLASLRQAMAEATRLNKRVLAVLYDDKHRQLSKLDYSLGYFMEYEATKAEVHENFVVAILPVSEAKHLVPTGTLETARWFLLDKHGSILAQQDVYANPDEGLKTVKALVMYGQQCA